MKKTLMIGLTGPTGAGKSSVRPVVEKLGCRYIDCDLLARKAVEPGTAALERLAAHFGQDIIRPDGTLDRPELARRAFPTGEGRSALNAIVHPAVIALVEEALERCAAEGIAAAVVDAPTLFESGLDKRCDSIVAVIDSEESRCRRIMRRDGITEEAARLRISAQPPNEYYSSRAEYTIVNDGTAARLYKRAERTLNHILKGDHQ